MGFLDNIFRKKKVTEEHSNKVEEKTFSKPAVTAIKPDLVCELTIDGNKYILAKLEADFDRSRQEKYIPIHMTFTEMLAPELESWITRSSMRKDGYVKFYLNSDKMREGAVFSMAFHNASCIGYSKNIEGDITKTTLEITAKGIELLREEYEME